ncbi:MAG: class I SAM-dependent methyltransferase [Anaerolineales bacterium]|nr:class I SAM-dependent methyltransferase [Anaerolineales bacterium]
MLLTLLTVLICLPVLALFLHTLVRIVRHFYKFPMPEFAANIIDNPLRRKFQPPAEMPQRHGVKEGMTVLEIGPGNGTYTIATAKEVGDSGQVITIDIEPKMITRVEERINTAAIKNIEARVADVFDLPFEEHTFDLIYMVAVIGEIPTPERAMEEFHRVLKPGGLLSFSEILMDPDYPLKKTLINLAEPVGFQLKNQVGNFFTYTLVFDKIDVLRE